MAQATDEGECHLGSSMLVDRAGDLLRVPGHAHVAEGSPASRQTKEPDGPLPVEAFVRAGEQAPAPAEGSGLRPRWPKVSFSTMSPALRRAAMQLTITTRRFRFRMAPRQPRLSEGGCAAARDIGLVRAGHTVRRSWRTQMVHGASGGKRLVRWVTSRLV